MKTILFLTLSLFTTLTFAQVDLGDVDMDRVFAKEIAAHNESEEVHAIIKDIENKYDVLCTGFVTAEYPYFQNRLVYKANCKNDNIKVRLKIISIFKHQKENILIKVKRYKVTVN